MLPPQPQTPPQPRTPPLPGFRHIFVAGLPPQMTEVLLHELFLQAGPLVSVRVPPNRGFGFVEYEDPESGPYAVELFLGLSLFGSPLSVREDRKR